MILPPQPEYFLISKDEVNFMRSSMFSDRVKCRKIMQEVISHPYQSEREPLNFSSSDLLLISHDEWKRREERKHIHDRIDWTAGWISGFLTSRKFVQDRVAELRQQAGYCYRTQKKGI
jgi:Cu/Ag efflux pump CusA